MQRSGDKIRVTAQLIRADDGFHVWSSNYDRTLNDIFAIQDEIATDVGRSLTTSLLGEEEVTIQSIGTHDVIAYDLYLQALTHSSNGSYEALGQAESLLKDALFRDPEFYDAKALLAKIYFDQQNTGLIGFHTALDNAAGLLEQVLASEPEHTMAKASLIYVNALRVEEKGAYMSFVDAVTEMRELLDTAPNDFDLLMTAGNFLSDAGHPEEALGYLERALEIDPINSDVHLDVGDQHQRLSDWDAAEAAFMRALELEPGNPDIFGRLANIAMSKGDAVESLRYMLEGMRLDSRDPERPSGIANWLYQFGVIEESDRYRDRAFLVSPDSPLTRTAVLMSAVARNDIEESDRRICRVVCRLRT